MITQMQELCKDIIEMNSQREIEAAERLVAELKCYVKIAEAVLKCKSSETTTPIRQDGDS